MVSLPAPILFLLLLSFSSLLAGQQEPSASDSNAAPVIFEGKTLFQVRSAYADPSVEIRAEKIADRLYAVAKNRNIPVSGVYEADIPGRGTILLARNTVLMTVTDEDALAEHASRTQVAADYVVRIRKTIEEYRDERSWQNRLKDIGLAVLVTLVLVLLFKLVRFAHRTGRARILLWKAGPSDDTSLIPRRRIGEWAVALERTVVWIVVAGLLEGYLYAVLRIFPGTSGAQRRLYGWLLSPLIPIWTGFVAYLPDLLVIAVIVIVTRYAIKLNSFVFKGIRDGKISISGFYPEWADPTSSLLRVVLVVLAAVVIFPYLPGAKSPAFQGISIFMGVLISFGSSSAVASGIAGIILTYMRPFHVGDWVQIAEAQGEVTEKDLLVTRIRTIKNVIITVPNSSILNSQILNYSTSAERNDLILYTSVTIGYDAPWRQVHSLLIQAALKSASILRSPEPFVLQTALDDFFVTYELNAYIAEPKEMVNIRAELHQNIQDTFNEAGVEIMSPHYASVRDGNASAIPDNYFPEGRKAKPFHVSVRHDRPTGPGEFDRKASQDDGYSPRI